MLSSPRGTGLFLLHLESRGHDAALTQDEELANRKGRIAPQWSLTPPQHHDGDGDEMSSTEERTTILKPAASTCTSCAKAREEREGFFCCAGGWMKRRTLSQAGRLTFRLRMANRGL